MIDASNRWIWCPCCGAPAECLVHLHCTQPGCRWYDERAEAAYLEECPPPGTPWVTWARPEEDGA